MQTDISPHPPSCWIITSGKAGMENQALGLAEAMGLHPVLKRIQLRTPWRQLSPWLRVGLAHAAHTAGDDVSPPWPALAMGVGRQSIPLVLHLRRASQHHAQPTRVIQLQDPVIDPKHFDWVVAPQHDQLNGPNVMATLGALHRITPARVAEAVGDFSHLWQHLPPPHWVVLLGGNNGAYTLGAAQIQNITKQLQILHAQRGGSFLVTASRRTGAQHIAQWRAAMQNMPHYFYDGDGPNPYMAMLGVAEALLVTCDSVNMLSEAASTGKPVYILLLAGHSAKFARFHQSLIAGQHARWFQLPLDLFQPRMLAEPERVAALLKNKLGLA